MIYLAKQKGQTFVFGAIILMLSNVLVKVIGMFFRIPLTNILGVDGMAYYNAAYSIYVSFYMISTAGIPVAISRMIAASNSQNNVKEVEKTFKLAYWVFFVIGAVGTAIMIVFSQSFADKSGMPDANLAIIAIAPTLFFICLSSAYRGFFQGLHNMVPSAVSQVIEALGKIGIGLFAAWYFYTVRGEELHVVAMYVISGVTIGVAAATIYAWITKKMFESAVYEANCQTSCDLPVRSTKSLLYELIITSLPIALASSIMGLTNTIDTLTMVENLMESGLSQEAAQSYYGTYSSLVIPLFNMAPPLIYPFGIAAIPALSKAIAINDKKSCTDNMQSAFRMGALIAIPCAIGMGCLSKGIISILFKPQDINVNGTVVKAFDLAAPALSIVASAIFFLAIISITNSIIQAYRFEIYTIISTVLGIIVKYVLTSTLSAVEGMGIMGSAVGTAAGYFVIMFVNMVVVITKIKFIPSIRKTFLKPLIAGVFCGVTAIVISRLLADFNIKVATLVSIVSAVAVYFCVIIIIKGINRADVLMMPKGDKVCRIMDKFNLLEKEI